MLKGALTGKEQVREKQSIAIMQWLLRSANIYFLTYGI
jgi:hypothetical protein